MISQPKKTKDRNRNSAAWVEPMANGRDYTRRDSCQYGVEKSGVGAAARFENGADLRRAVFLGVKCRSGATGKYTGRAMFGQVRSNSVALIVRSCSALFGPVTGQTLCQGYYSPKFIVEYTALCIVQGMARNASHGVAVWIRPEA
jgi:hypothetical protein